MDACAALAVAPAWYGSIAPAAARAWRWQPAAGAPTAPAAVAGGLDPRRLQRVLAFVEQHLDDDVSIEALSAVACLSKFHFARAFKAATGRSPHRHVSERRLQRAKAMLATGEASLVDIAMACRFSSQANFCRAFRRAEGISPGRFRALAAGKTVRFAHGT